MHDVLLWLYGKSARNTHIREMAEKAIKLLQKNSSMNYQELCKELGIGFDKYQKPRRTFYFVVNPLKKVQMIEEKRIFDQKNKKKYQTHYIFTPERFRGYMGRIIDEFYSLVKQQ